MNNASARLVLVVSLLALGGCVAEGAPLDKLDGDATTEDFDLPTDSITRPTEMGALTSGATVNGTFASGARYLAWTFAAEAGDTVEISAEGVSPRWLDTVVSVYRTSAALRPTGRALASNDDCDPSTLGSCVTLTAPERATYAIVVRRYDRGSSGTFALSLDVTPAEGAHCDAVVASIEGAAANVWFLSESDRALTVQIVSGEESAPTLESVVARAMAPADASATVRATDTFALHFEPAPGAADEAPAALTRALAGLTDTLFVAIVAPSDPAVVRVIFVGRTACGDLVWIESVSIET